MSKQTINKTSDIPVKSHSAKAKKPSKFDAESSIKGQLIRDPNDEKMWVATGYALVDKILKDKRFGKQAPAGTSDRLPMALRQRSDRQKIKPLSSLDPPEHSRVRKLLSKALDPLQIEKRRHTIQLIVDLELDQLIPKGCMDLIDDYCYPVSSTIISELLGIPQEIRMRLQHLSEILIDAHSTDLSNAHDKQKQDSRVQDAQYEFDQAISNLIEQHKHQPTNDVMGILLSTQGASKPLSNAELVVNVRAFYIATHENLVNLIGNCLLALHKNHQQWQLLKAMPALVPGAIDELLRYDSPIKHVFRIARQDAHIAGEYVKAGEAIFCSLHSANHDENVFPCPATLDIHRNHGKPKSFGSGIHFCLGAPLVRIATTILLTSLIKRIPCLVLNDSNSLPRRVSATVHGVAAMPAKW